MKRINETLIRWYGSNRLPTAIILIGIVLRVAQYLSNRPLWIDECLLVINLQQMPLSDLLKPLIEKQIAPVGFLTIESFMLRFFGNNEWSLRLLPLLAGIASLPVFHHFAAACAGRRTVILALGLFALSDPLIYYSSEVKP